MKGIIRKNYLCYRYNKYRNFFWKILIGTIVFHSALPSIRQETFFLNPLLDFDDTFDYSNFDYDSYVYGTSNSSDESQIISYEEQNNRSIEDGGTYGYDTSSTIIANFLTDSTTVEDFYTNSTWSQDETATSTIIETSTMEGKDYYFN